jgi:predicted dehydrogenase
MAKALGWGIIGLGRIAYPFADALIFSKSNIVACASQDAQRLEQFTKTYGVKNTYLDYSLLYKDPDVDIVYIATPHSLHFSQMMEILDHGKHILCEKSFTLNYAEALKVFSKAKEKNLFVMEGLWSHFLPIWEKIETMIIDKVIGEVTSLQLTLTFDGQQRGQKRLFDRSLGGGALLDLGIYVLNFAVRMLGQPLGIEGKLDFSTYEVDVDDSLQLIYPQAKTHLDISLIRQSPRDNWIHGTLGSIYIPQFHRAEALKRFNLEHECVEEITIPHPLNGFEYQIQHVTQMIHQGLIESSIHPAYKTLKIFKLMDLIRKKNDFYWDGESSKS